MLLGISLKKRGRGRERERKKEKKKHGVTAVLMSEAQKLCFSKGTFIPCLIHRGK